MTAPPSHWPLSAHARKVLEAVGARDTSVVSSSWRRCLQLHRLDPDAGHARMPRGADEVAAATRRCGALIAAAGATLDSLFAVVGEAGGTVLMTDANGVVVAERVCGGHDFWHRTGHHWTGLDLSEPSEGTNAVGVCLIEQRPIVIADGNHFYADNARLISIGAPIFGPAGTLVGCIDVVRPESEPSAVGALILSIAIDAARRIELDLFAHEFPDARMTLVAQNGRHATAVLAIDDHDRVVGATRAARRLLALTEAKVAASFPASEIWGGDATREPTLMEQERLVIKRTLARHSGNISETAKALGIGRGTLHRKIKDMGAWLEA